MASPEAQKALSRAKIHLMSTPDTTFFSVVCCNLLHEWTKKLPTAATDGVRIFYNEEFFMHCKPAERIGLLLHEILHVVFQHMLPLPTGWNHRKANRAMDYAINLIIDKAKFKLPDGALLDYQYDGMGWKEIYELLDDEDDDDLPMDDIIICDGNGSALKDQIDDIIVQAAQASQQAGDSAGAIPGAVQRYLDDLLRPQIPWHTVMRKFFTKLAKVNYSFIKPNRRFFPQGILMPSMTGMKVSKGAVGVDTSGSVSIPMFNDMVAETAAILRDQQPEVLHFLQFDTRICQHDELKTLRELKSVQFSGCGGTDIEPIMQWAKEENPNWLIVFTDGYFSDPKTKPKCPVIWVIHSNPSYKAPFGKTIHYTFKEDKA